MTNNLLPNIIYVPLRSSHACLPRSCHDILGWKPEGSASGNSVTFDMTSVLILNSLMTFLRGENEAMFRICNIKGVW